MVNDEKVMVFGIGQMAERIFSVFPGLLDYVELFIDSFSKKKTFFGIKVIHPEKIPITNNTFVIASRFKEKEIKNIITEKGYSESVIISLRNWVVSMLSRHHDISLIPRRVRIEACTYCQLRCKDCYMRNRKDIIVGEGNLKLNDFKNFISKNPFIEEIELSDNGEVFLNPDISKILKCAYDNSIKITLINGVNFNTVSDQVLEDIVRYKVHNMTISIDGASQNIYSEYRIGGNYNVVIDNIKRINNYKRKYHSDYPHLTWQFVLMEHNECDVETAKEMAQDLSMDIFYKLSFSGVFSPKDRIKMEKITGLSCFNRSEYEEKYGKNYMYPVCEHMIWQPQINWDGRLLGCCNNYTYGDWGKNVFNEDYLHALNEEPYRLMIIKLLGGDIEVDGTSPCLKCENYHKNIKNGKYVEL